MHTGTAAILALALVSSHSSAGARDPSKPACKRTVPEWYDSGPSVLNDPRSGLTLYLEADGRHMVAKTHQGKIVWQRNLFADPRLDVVCPPYFHVPGELPLSEAKWRQQHRACMSKMSVTSIRVVSDCETHIIDGLSPLLRGHYIRAASGTRVWYLLDAKTGDFMIEQTN